MIRISQKHLNHYVKFINESITSIDIVEEARKIRYSDRFAKEGINVNFVQIMDDGSLAVRTYERGVEDETYSCGTGVTASANSAESLTSLTRGKKVYEQVCTVCHTKGQLGAPRLGANGPTRTVKLAPKRWTRFA